MNFLARNPEHTEPKVSTYVKLGTSAIILYFICNLLQIKQF